VARGVGWLRSGDATKGLHFAARSGRVVGLLLGVASAAAVIWLEVVDGLMIALCGWFLISTARSIERGAGLDRLLDGLFVADVMDRDVASLAPTLTVDTFGDQVLDGTAAMALPVRFGDRLMGIVGARQIRQLRRDRWATTRAEEVMVALPRLPIMTPETSLRAALDGLARARTDGLPVMVDGELTGIVTRRGVSEAVRARASKTGQAIP
jgi:CBS-domain-containing membrane protein